MPRLAIILAVLAIVVTGALFAWPQVRGYWLYQRTTARILDVLPETLADGRVRLSVAYEFELPRDPKQPGRYISLGWQIGDSFFRPMEDPIVEATRSDLIIRKLLDADASGRLFRTVFFTANDPVGTAFILDETAAVPTNRLQLGAVLIGIGLLGGLYAWRRGAE